MNKQLNTIFLRKNILDKIWGLFVRTYVPVIPESGVYLLGGGCSC